MQALAALRRPVQEMPCTLPAFMKFITGGKCRRRVRGQVCPLPFWIIRAADVLLSVRQAEDPAGDEEACVFFQQS